MAESSTAKAMKSMENATETPSKPKIKSASPEGTEYKVFSLRISTDVYEELRYRSFTTRESMNSIVCGYIDKCMAEDRQASE